MKGAQHDARRIRRQLLAKDAKWRLVGSAIEHGRMRNPVLAPRPRMFCREPISKHKQNRRSGTRKDKGWFRDYPEPGSACFPCISAVAASLRTPDANTCVFFLRPWPTACHPTTLSFHTLT